MTSGSLFMSWWQSCYINYHASHEKSTQRTDNKRSSMETIIFALQTTPINSKITESLIINLTQNLWKTTWGAYSRGRPPPPLKFGPPPLPSESPLPSVEGGGGWGYGYFLELHNAYLAGYRIEGGGVHFLAVKPPHVWQNCEGFSNTHLQDNLRWSPAYSPSYAG